MSTEGADRTSTQINEETNESSQSQTTANTEKTTPTTTVGASAASVKTSQPQPTDKVQILLKPTGSSRAIKKQKWMVTRDKTVGGITQFLKKQLSIQLEETLFLYVKQTFCPSADVEIGTLYECFGSDGRLVFHYCTMEAWG